MGSKILRDRQTAEFRDLGHGFILLVRLPALRLAGRSGTGVLNFEFLEGKRRAWDIEAEEGKWEVAVRNVDETLHL